MMPRCKLDGDWYGWVVVFASHMIQVLAIGCEVSIGVFLVPFMEYFGEGAGKTAAIQSIQAGMYLCPAPLVSSLNRKFGTRLVVVTGGILSSIGLLISSFANSVYTLYVSYGIIGGFGIGLAYGPSIVIVGQYFDKRHALANGLVYAGVGVGVMIFPPIYQLLIDKYGWRGALLIISAINMNIIVCGVLLREPIVKTSPLIQVKEVELTERKQQNEFYSSEELFVIKLRRDTDEANSTNPNEIGRVEEAECSEQITHKQMIKTREQSPTKKSLSEILGLKLYCERSWLRILCMSTFFMGLGHKVTTVHFISKAVSDGIDKLDAAFLMTIMGTASLIGRVVHGWFVDLGHFTPMFIGGCTFMLAGVSLLLPSVAHGNYTILGVIAAWYGFTIGICIPLGAVSVKYCLGVEHLSIAFGWTLLHSGLGNTIGPPLAGWIYDITDNYNLSFLLAGASLILSGSLLISQLGYKRWRNERVTSQPQSPCKTGIEHEYEGKGMEHSCVTRI